MANFAADFLGGLNQGLGRGMNMYAQLQQMANQQRQMQMQEQAQQRLMQTQQMQAQQDKVNTLVNVSKLKDPNSRKAVLNALGPQYFGYDPNDPAAGAQYQGLVDALGSEDQQLLKLVQQAGAEAGVPPGMAALAAQADPNVAAAQIFGYNRMQNSNEMAQMRLDQGDARLKLAQLQAALSGDRLGFQQDKFAQRMAGNIPPIGYTPQLSAQGDLQSLTPIPGGPATIPSEGERKASGQYESALASAQAGEQFMRQHPEYLGSLRAQIDQTLATGAEPIASGVGAVAGGIGGAALGASMHIPGWAAVGGGTYAGKELGKGFAGMLERVFQSDEGKQFKAAWAPFLNANLRRETGAAINEHEWQDAFSRFIPMPGDSPEVQATKEQNRASALKNIQIGAGRAAEPHTPAMGDTQLRDLATKYRSGKATPEEIDTLKKALRAKGLNVQ